MKLQEARLGYLMVSSPLANVYIGGLMVVDGRGLPIEFRYTEPIQPTRIQQILYGSVLTRYIKTEVILESLIKSLESHPDLILVNDESFLVKEVSIKDLEMVRVTETKSSPLKALGGFERISSREFLLQLTPESSPIRIHLSGGDGSPGAPSGGQKTLPDKSKEPDIDFSNTRVYSTLFEVGRVTDILEPLNRVEKALAVLCQEAGIKASAN